MHMDLSDLRPSAGDLPSGRPFAQDIGPDSGFRDLVGQLGRETAVPLTSALERVNAFATTGRIDRSSLRALREEIEAARRNGIIAQQISRFASGRVRQVHERLNLTQALRDALAQRARETAARGIDLRQELKPTEVVVDAAMLTALLQALLDWSFEHARSHIEFRLDLKPWPAHARLTCRFAHVPADEVASAALALPGLQAHHVETKLDTMPWQLLHRLALMLSLVVQRQDTQGGTQLSLEFPRTVDDSLALPASLDFDEAAAGGPNSQPMAGSHVLVIAARRETRNVVRETVRPMGLMVDYVNSVEEAREFCSTGVPHAIVFESALAGGNFRKLRAEWSAEVPTLAFIEISEEGRAFEVCDLGGSKTSRIGRDVIASSLPAALMFELAKST
jgi:hypothetical protein